MEITIRTNTDDLTVDVIDGIKKMFPHKMVAITIQPADEAGYMLNDPEFTEDLSRMEE